MTCFRPSINIVTGRVLIAIFITTLSCDGALAQKKAPSALQVAENSSFFKVRDRKVRESAADVIASLERAVKAGADINETDSDGNSAFMYALAYAVTNIDGAEANPIVKALFRLGVDVNKLVGPSGEAYYPICLPLIWGTFNYDLLNMLLDAGASTKVKCEGLSLEETARRQTISPDLLPILKKRL
jgi:hypothetical protein